MEKINRDKRKGKIMQHCDSCEMLREYLDGAEQELCEYKAKEFINFTETIFPLIMFHHKKLVKGNDPLDAKIVNALELTIAARMQHLCQYTFELITDIAGEVLATNLNNIHKKFFDSSFRITNDNS